MGSSRHVLRWTHHRVRRSSLPCGPSLWLQEINQNNINSLAPGRCASYLKFVTFKVVSRINILSISCEIVLRWMPQGLIDGKSTLVQVMAWCRLATSHYLSQCWPRSLSPTRHMASLGHKELTHCGLVTPHGITDLGHHWLRKWLGAEQETNHYLNKWFCCQLVPPKQTSVKFKSIFWWLSERLQ